MKKALLTVGAPMLLAIMVMASAAPVMAQTAGPDFTTQPNKKSPLESGKWKAPDVVGTQKKNPVKPPVYPPRPGYPQQSSPSTPPAYKPVKPQQTNKPNAPYVAKQNQDSPARVSCLAKCGEARNKYRADCNKSPDPVEASYCVKRGDSTYNFCAGKCPAK